MSDNQSVMRKVSCIQCGQWNNDPVYLITVVNEDVTVTLTNFGSAITAIYMPDRHGIQKNIVAGFSQPVDYENNPHYFGCVLGRYAGRIAGGSFILDGKKIQLSQNENGNHLHGGFDGFNKKIWKIKSFTETNESVSVTMEYLSGDGEEGYPGSLWVTIKYTLNFNNQLLMQYDAVTDKSTPVNFSNHSYFNLSGFETGNILDHKLSINANCYTEKNGANLPTGNILTVADTPLDFLSEKMIGQDIQKFGADEGFNHNYALADHLPGEVIFAAKLKDENSGRTLKVYTDQPAIQLYSANDWNGSICGPQGYCYQKHGAVALETQAFPDAPNQPGFPDPILHPNRRYLTTTIYEFETEANNNSN